MTTRVLFYVQHLLGIGHFSRASLICQKLVEQGADVKMVIGGTPVPGFPGPGVNAIYLPPLKAGCLHFNDLTDANGVKVDQHYLDNRRDQLLAVFDAFRPDVLVIEAFPFGRRQMRFELIPLLDKARQAEWKPVIAGSVRDIVQENKKPKRLRETVDTLNRYFDLLLVHGDPDFVPFGASFELANEISHLISYTGLVSAGVPELAGPTYDVVVSAGGGAAGRLIMQTAIRAQSITKLAGAKWLFLTGQHLAREVRDQLEAHRNPHITIQTHRTDFRALLAHAKLSISQAGYNTTADILRAKCSSVMIPFATGGETEQTRRADRLSALGLAVSVSEQGLTAAKLARIIDQSVAPPVSAKNVHEIGLNGAERSAEMLRNARNYMKKISSP